MIEIILGIFVIVVVGFYLFRPTSKKVIRLMVQDLVILDDGSTNTCSVHDRSSIVGSTCFFTI